jgi:hypothetical protein
MRYKVGDLIEFDVGWRSLIVKVKRWEGLGTETYTCLDADGSQWNRHSDDIYKYSKILTRATVEVHQNA